MIGSYVGRGFTPRHPSTDARGALSYVEGQAGRKGPPHPWRCTMAVVRVTRSGGMLLLAIWLILSGLAGFAAVPIPGVVMAALALIAGALILVGR